VVNDLAVAVAVLVQQVETLTLELLERAEQVSLPPSLGLLSPTLVVEVLGVAVVELLVAQEAAVLVSAQMVSVIQTLLQTLAVVVAVSTTSLTAVTVVQALSLFDMRYRENN
jgi:hypothetical protein